MDKSVQYCGLLGTAKKKSDIIHIWTASNTKIITLLQPSSNQDAQANQVLISETTMIIIYTSKAVK